MNEINSLKQEDSYDIYLSYIGITCNLQQDIREYQKANQIITNRIKISGEGETKEYLGKASSNLLNAIKTDQKRLENLELKIDNYIQQENVGGNK